MARWESPRLKKRKKEIMYRKCSVSWMDVSDGCRSILVPVNFMTGALCSVYVL